MIAGLILAASLCQAPPVHPATSDSFLDLMADPEAAAIIVARAPAYVRLLEQQVVAPPSPEVTLDDFARIPETRMTPEILRQIEAEFAALRRQRERNRPQ